METKLVFKYDREGDILYINKRPPYPEQESEELGDEVIARLNPKTGEVENLEVLFFQLDSCAAICSNYPSRQTFGSWGKGSRESFFLQLVELRSTVRKTAWRSHQESFSSAPQ